MLMRKSVTDKAETPIAHRTSSSWFGGFGFVLFSHRSGPPWQPARMREEYLQQPLQQLVGSEGDCDIPKSTLFIIVSVVVEQAYTTMLLGEAVASQRASEGSDGSQGT